MITLKQLAKELKVSISTVSKALRDSPEISSETIEKVKFLANKYNYRPNKIALSLKSNRTLTIGVVIPDILNRFYSKVLNGIHDSADQHGYDVITINSKESMLKEIDSLQILSSGNVDGVIIAMSEETLNKNDYSHIKEFTMKETPIVMFDRVTDKINCDKVIIDDFDAIYNEVKSLKDLGRKKIGFITTINDLNVGKYRANDTDTTAAGGGAPFIYTGFRPQFIVIKRLGGTQTWCVYDDKRGGNDENPPVEWDVAGAEQTNAEINICSNGFI